MESNEPTNNIKHYRLGLLVCQTYCVLCQSISLAIFGPVMTEFVLRLGVSYEELSYAFAAKGIGVLIGALIGGLVKDKFITSSELGVAGGLAVTAISYFVMPYCPSVWQLGVANVFHGIGYGIINSINIAYVVALWKYDSARVLSLAYGLGSFGRPLTPVIVTPFLSTYTEVFRYNQQNVSMPDIVYMKRKHTIPYANNNYSVYNDTTATGYISIEDYNENFHWAFIICGLILTLNALAFITAFIFRPVPVELFKDYIVNTCEKHKSRKKPPTWYVFLQYVAMALFCGTGNICTSGSFDYIFSMALSMGFSKTQAALLNTVDGIMLSLSRSFFAIVLSFVSEIKVLNLVLICGMISALTASLYGVTSHVGLWVTSLLFIFFAGPAYPCWFGYVNNFIHVSGMMVAIAEVGQGLGRIATNPVLAVLFTNYGSWSIWLMFSCIYLELFILSLMVYKVSTTLQIKNDIFDDNEEEKCLMQEEHK